jgi:hypothetical protein
VVKVLGNSLGGGEANFYNVKFFAFRYFFEYELPRMGGLAKRFMNSDGLTLEKDLIFSQIDGLRQKDCVTACL